MTVEMGGTLNNFTAIVSSSSLCKPVGYYTGDNGKYNDYDENFVKKSPTYNYEKFKFLHSGWKEPEDSEGWRIWVYGLNPEEREHRIQMARQAKKDQKIDNAMQENSSRVRDTIN